VQAASSARYTQRFAPHHHNANCARPRHEPWQAARSVGGEIAGGDLSNGHRPAGPLRCRFGHAPIDYKRLPPATHCYRVGPVARRLHAAENLPNSAWALSPPAALSDEHLLNGPPRCEAFRTGANHVRHRRSSAFHETIGWPESGKYSRRRSSQSTRTQPTVRR